MPKGSLVLFSNSFVSGTLVKVHRKILQIEKINHYLTIFISARITRSIYRICQATFFSMSFKTQVLMRYGCLKRDLHEKSLPGTALDIFIRTVVTCIVSDRNRGLDDKFCRDKSRKEVCLNYDR